MINCLTNYKKVCYDSSELEVSLSLFSADSFDKMRKLTNNPRDIKIIEELERLAMDEEFKLHYNAEAVKRKTENSIKKESYRHGLEDGITQGIEEGSKQKEIEIAQAMLNEKLNMQLISRTTGLSVEEIEALQ